MHDVDLPATAWCRPVSTSALMQPGLEARLPVWRVTIRTVLLCTALALPVVHAQTALADGRAVYDYWCATCHSEGPLFPGTTALAAKYNGEINPLLTARTDMTPEFIRVMVRGGVSVMPAFRKTEITDAQLLLLTEFLTARDAD